MWFSFHCGKSSCTYIDTMEATHNESSYIRLNQDPTEQMTFDQKHSMEALLKKWGLSELIPKFQEESIDYEALQCLDSSLVAEIVPKPIGLRAKLLNRLEKWNLNSKIKPVGQEDPSTPSTSTSTLQSNPGIKFPPESSASDEPTDINEIQLELDVNEVLMLHPEGEVLLKHYTQERKLDRAERNIIAALIINYCVVRLKTINNVVMAFCAKKIVEEFPTENIETYYIGPKEEGPNQKISKGKLPDRYRYIQKKKKRKVSQMLDQTTHEMEYSVEDNEFLQSVQKGRRQDTLSEKQLWLKYNREPWDEVIQYWRDTSSYRMKLIADTEETDRIAHLFHEWPILKQHPKAYVFFEIDYGLKYPDSGKFFFNWKKYKNGIKRLLQERIRDKHFKSILFSIGEDSSASVVDAVLLLGMPYLCPSSNKVLIRGIWKPSFEDVQKGFILYVKTPGDIEPAIREKERQMNFMNLPIQPFCIFQGHSPLSISHVYVKIREMLFHVETPLKAIEICFKAIRVLDVSYPIESENLWLFIQKCFFNLQTKKDRKIPSVASLISDLVSEERMEQNSC